ncbi:FAD-dependent monooxygenase [Blastococcus haudaquaticus]|uniref:2-polyprenyl-6-methoxyphenol hydroxylase n=1 Tax=Blastococcus haudaquaticus TaxID=1938745 RepID=A0A286GT56_9ACTN|nr:FAD-dependent monooxygenase [Blastococcus haudaquaticus]SOD98741.1 2-polyprenyl-6-methoxyphenol hydroxylase [Blastococcus haudaquaticus]
MPSSEPAPVETGTAAGAGRRAVVVGASLAGLMSSLALADSGWHVTVLERAGARRCSGAALAVDPADLVRLLGPTASATVLSRLGTDVSDVSAGLPATWQALHTGLQAAADAHHRIVLHHHSPVVDVGQDEERAWAIDASGPTHTADFLVGADGYRSVVRSAVSPDKPDARFAGYVLWLGVAAERDLGLVRWPSGLDIRDSGDHLLLGYPLPGVDGSRTPGNRRLGWAWYDATRNQMFRRAGAVVGSGVRYSLRPADIPERTYAELAAEAGRRWPAPWAQAIGNSVARHDVTATPISEYLPDRLVRGRLALVGDAAHVPTPMTGSGFAASLADAEALAHALAECDSARAPDGLRAYEKRRLAPARSLVLSGQQFSRSFAGR